MSLHIYTSTDLIPNGIEYELMNDIYSNKHHLRLPDTKEVRFLLKYIEDAEYQTEMTFIGKFVPGAGILNRFLSTSAKTALNILLSKDICFDTMSCGEEALRAIIYLRDGYAVIEDGFMMHEDGDIDVIVNDTYRFFRIDDYIDYVDNGEEDWYDKDKWRI